MSDSVITIRLKHKVSGIESKPVNIEEIIFCQNDIEFIFNGDPDGILDETSLPYKDFLFYQDEYEVIIKVEKSK